MKLKIEDEKLVISREKIRQSTIIKRPLTNIKNLDKLIKIHNETFTKVQKIKNNLNPLLVKDYCKNCLHYNGSGYIHGINGECKYENCKCINFEPLNFEIEIIIPEQVKEFNINYKPHKAKGPLFWLLVEFQIKFKNYVKE